MRWAELYHTVRKERIAGRAELTSMAGRIERLALRIVAILESRAVEGREARGCAKDASAITDEDRLRALLAFCERLRITDPAGFAAIRRVLDDDDAGAPRAPRRSQGGSHAD